MSVQAIAWVLDNSQSRGLSRLVLISIANHADKFGREAFPAVKTIAAEAGVSEREVQYCIRELSEIGEVQVEFKASKYGTNVYSLSKMHPANCAPGVVQAPRKESAPVVHTLAPEPSLTVKRIDLPSADISNLPHEERIKIVNQRLDDYYNRRWQNDEKGRYLISPSTGEKVYEACG